MVRRLSHERHSVTVVVPIFNEFASLLQLHERLLSTLRALDRSYQVVYVDDGSTDGSRALLGELARRSTDITVVLLNRNYGQHAAIFAGFSVAAGEVIVTIDADMQNPPEEIPKLLAETDKGHDVVGGYRRDRQDSAFRRFVSRRTNRMLSSILGSPIRDCGCMLRAYRRDIAERMSACSGNSTFIPALALTLATNPIEIEVEHAARLNGDSKYSILRLLRLQTDLITSFSMFPLRLCSLLGAFVAAAGLGFSGFLILRRFIVGPEVEGAFTLFAILFFFVGLLFLGLGVLGEYVGRIYAQVSQRPRYLIQHVLGSRESRHDGLRNEPPPGVGTVSCQVDPSRSGEEATR